MEKASKNEVLNVGGELLKLTNSLTCRMVMSTRCSGDDEESKKYIKLVRESFELAAKLCFSDVPGPLKKLGFWIYGKQAVDASKRYDELLERVLKEHEERAERDGERVNEDVMDILLKVYKDEKAKVKMTRTHIKAYYRIFSLQVLTPQLKACNGQMQSSSTILMHSRRSDRR